MAKDLRKYLVMKSEDIKMSKELREAAIDAAVALPTGPSREEKEFSVLWVGEGYEVGVGKPGKETTRKVANANINDMWPFIRKDGVFQNKDATFDDIFRELEHLGTRSKHALELLGCLLARSAYMLDHEVLDGRIVYSPPKEVVQEISKEISSMYHVPLEVFLQYLEAIALNEDVKYQRRLNAKGEPYSKDAGRPNNLLTCAHLIAVLLGRATMIGFATGFAKQRGVSAIRGRQLLSSFPMLDIDTKGVDLT